MCLWSLKNTSVLQMAMISIHARPSYNQNTSLRMLLTCVCVWWRWTACHPSSCRWSCRSAGPGIPPPSSETTAAASLWPSCHPTDRSPEYLRSVGQDGQIVSHTNYRDLLSYQLDLCYCVHSSSVAFLDNFLPFSSCTKVVLASTLPFFSCSCFL